MEYGFRRISARGYGEWSSYYILIDLLTYQDPDAILKVVQGPDFFGRVYKKRELGRVSRIDKEYDLPFRLDRGGQIDFGHAFDDEDRYGNTNMILPNHRLAEQFMLDDGDDEMTFKVTRIIDLAQAVSD